jgi:hypothetical protein
VPSVGNPRDFRRQALDRKRLVVVANSSVGWSLARTQEYCTRRGVPLSAIISIPLGTDPVTWTPASNAAMEATFVTPLAALIQSRLASGVLLGPGCPARVAVVGQVNGASYTPAAVGYPPLYQLAAGAGRYFARLASEVSVFALPCVVAWIDNGSGRFTWAGWDGLLGATLWPSTLWGQVGSTDTALAPLLSIVDAVPTGATNVPTAALTALIGRAQSNQLPVGRIGYSGWYTPGGAVPESDSNALASLVSADRAMSADTVAPVLVSISTISAPDGNIWAALVERLRTWGYPVQYVYRDTPGGPGSFSEINAPVAGAVASTAAFTSTVTGLPYSLLAGCALNTDTPNSAGVGFNTLAPVPGGGVSSIGASGGWEWGLRQLTLGAAWAMLDQTHKNLSVHQASWVGVWLLLTGMSVMEAVYWSSNAAGYLACGDPLFSPFPLNLYQPPGERFGRGERASRTRAWRAPR